MERQITKQEEQTYRFRHHDFGGLTTKETAVKMGVSKCRVNKVLRNLQRKAPQLFPILTPHQNLVYRMYVGHGLSQSKIAKLLGVKQQAICETINRMRANGVAIVEPEAISEVVSYNSEMDNYITRKF